MKILLVNHGTASEWGGGDGVQMRETAARLEQRGHQVEIQNSDTPQVGDADLVRIFNCRVFNSFVQQVRTCKAAGKPTVVSPIWINIGRALWGSRGTFGLLQKAVTEGEGSVQQELELLRTRQLKVHLKQGSLDALGGGSYDLRWQTEVGNLLNSVEGLLPNSWLELKSVQTDLHWSGDLFRVAHSV